MRSATPCSSKRATGRNWPRSTRGSPIATLAGLPTGPGRVARVIAFRHLAGDRAACHAAVAATIEAVKAKKIDPQLLIRPLVLSDHVYACVVVYQLRCGDGLRSADRPEPRARCLPPGQGDPSAAGKTDWAAWLKDGGKRVTPQRSALGTSVAKRSTRLAKTTGAGIVYGCM